MVAALTHVERWHLAGEVLREQEPALFHRLLEVCRGIVDPGEIARRFRAELDLATGGAS